MWRRIIRLLICYNDWRRLSVMVKEFAVGQAITAVTHLSGSIADLAFDAGKDYFKSRIDERKLYENLMSYIEHCDKYNYMCSLAEEIDFQGLMDYIDGQLLDDVTIRIFSPNKKKRGNSRQNIINRAIVFSEADTDQARKRVTRLIGDTLDIVRDFYSKKVSREEWLVAAEIVDAVTDEVNNSEKRIVDVVTASTHGLEAKIDELNRNSQFSLEAYYSMGQQGNFNGIENNLHLIAEVLSQNHPLYPDYGFEINGNKLKSKALTSDAEKKYPSKYVCRGVAKMGNTFLNRIDADTFAYADRHQLQITLSITEAKKLLGTFDDPDQTEAINMVGQTVVRPPKEFPPAFPCNIKLDDEIVYEYVELRTAEILDDGTYVVNNSEQKHCHFRIEIRFSFADPQKKVYYTMKTVNPTNLDLLRFTKMMKKASDGSNITIYALNMGKDLMAGYTDPFKYETGFESIDDEIDFLQRVCDIESYTGKSIEIPDQITEREVLQVNYVSELIRGNENEFEWSEQSFKGIIDVRFREAIAEMSDDYHSLAIAGESTVKLFKEEFKLPILRKFRCAKIKDMDRFKKKLEYSENGEEIQISFIAGEDNSFFDCLEPENLPKSLNE